MTEQHQPHIVRSFGEQLKALNDSIQEMGGLTLESLDRSMKALGNRDEDLATRVIEGDSRIDELNQRIQEEAVTVLALRQPMAEDLRVVVSALRVSSELERIGDYAANIAKRVVTLANAQDIPSVRVATRMGALAREILDETMQAYDSRDARWAAALWHRDVEVDDLHTGLFRELLTYMMEDPRYITPCTHLVFAAKNIERIGDHASNISEITHYLATGEPLPGERPKADMSSSLAQPEAD